MTGTRTLTTLLLHSNRIRLLLWASLIPALLALGAASIKSLYPTQTDWDAYAAIADLVPAQIAFNGPPTALTTLGGIIIFETGWLLMLAACVANILLTVRLTRGQEEAGALEVLRAGRVSAGAPLVAVAVLIVSLNALLGVSTATVLVLAGTSVFGAVTYGAALFAVGTLFGAIAACTAQLSERARTASGLALAVLGVSFLARAIGDVSDAPSAAILTWVSPLGWAQSTEPFGANRWLPIALLLGATAVTSGAAWQLNATRDLGAGVIAGRPGRVRAARWATTPMGLQVRLARGGILAWTAGVVILSGAFGAMATTADDFAASSEATTDLIASFGGTSLSDAFIVFSLVIVGLIAAGCTISQILRMHGDEEAGRLAILVTAPQRRATVAASYVLTGFTAGFLLLATGGLALGAAYAAGTDDWSALTAIWASSLAHFPAVMVLAGVAAVGAAMTSRGAAFAWGVYAITAILTVLGPALSLPEWAVSWSVFDHVASYPAVTWNVSLITIGAALAVAAAVGFTRRDMRS